MGNGKWMSMWESGNALSKFAPTGPFEFSRVIDLQATDIHPRSQSLYAKLIAIASQQYMASDVLQEEFEVLESIYPAELTKLSESEITIAVEPEESVAGVDQLKVLLQVGYSDSYPDELPTLSLSTLEGSLEDNDVNLLLEDLETTAAENLGIAMTFTLISRLRERLLQVLQIRVEKLKQAALEKERLELEIEEARTRGTPVTKESFLAWKKKFDKDMAIRRAAEQEERLKSLPPKEREEARKISIRLTGRQLFERDRSLATSDATLAEEGAVSIDISQYDRIDTFVEETEEEVGLQFSDSE